MFLAFDFFIPAQLGITFFVCSRFWDRKSRIKYPTSRAFFPVCFLPYKNRSCMHIATSNQNKPSRLLYLGDAQITSLPRRWVPFRCVFVRVAWVRVQTRKRWEEGARERRQTLVPLVPSLIDFSFDFCSAFARFCLVLYEPPKNTHTKNRLLRWLK